MGRTRRKINPRNRKVYEKPEVNLPQIFVKTVSTFVPKIGKWISQIKDPRNPNQIDYDLELLIWTALFVAILRLKSIRGITYLIGRRAPDAEVFLRNFKLFFNFFGIAENDIKALPDYGTVNNILNRLDIRDVEMVIIKIVKRLIRKKVFENLRLLDEYYLLAVDGSRTVRFKEQHCKHCLKRKISEDKDGAPIYEYYHYVLDAKIVTHTGLCFPVITEFVENQAENQDKQDCELKAFYRLSNRLKGYFPRLKIVLLFDSLYAAAPVFSICKKHKWQFIARYKEGSIPTLYKEYQDLLLLSQENQGFHQQANQVSQRFQWVNDIDYQGHSLHVIEMKESKPNKKGGLKTTKFCYLSSLRITQNNYKKLVNKGGRCRWKIENQGFQTLKDKQGYNAAHSYNLDPNGGNIFYLLLQIGYTLNQLMQNSNLLTIAIKERGSIRNLAHDLFVAFSVKSIPLTLFEDALQAAYQIRLDSS